MQQGATYPSLAGRGIFITGGATGIGAALVRAFTAQHALVTFVDLQQAEGEDLVAELDGKPTFQYLDVTNTESLQEVISEANEGVPLGVLINNAANDMRHVPGDMSASQWRDCLAINLDAAFFAAQAAAPMMAVNGGGSIINFSSINATLGPGNMPGYVSAKAGLLGMTKALAKDYGVDFIRVNAISPGWVVTQRQLDTWLTQEAEAAWMAQVALPQRLMPEDVANLALFLASNDSHMITGQNFTIDGGRT